MSDTSNKPTTGLLSEALASMSSLVRNEVDLARAEINESAKSAAAAIGLLAGALVLALTALNVLSAALVAGLTEAGLHGGWAALIVGLGFAIIAYAMVHKGLDDLKLSNLAPTRAAKNVKRDAEAVKEAYNDN